jgi:hypothetical protein
MNMMSVPCTAVMLGASSRRLAASAYEQMGKPFFAGYPPADSALEAVIDRLCLSLAVAKPIGLVTWAEREGKRFGVSVAADFANAATHAIASAARSQCQDYGQFLAALHGFKAEVDTSLRSLQSAGSLTP